MMIRILELESSKGWGGQEKRTVRVINNLSSEFEVFFAVQKDSTLLKRKNEINAKFFDVNLNKAYNLTTIFKLCRFVLKNDIKIISTHSGKDAWIGNIVGALTKRKVIRVRHLILPIHAFGYNLNDKVVCVSKEVKNALIRDGVKKEKLKVIYTGVDTDKFRPSSSYDLRAQLGLGKDCLLVGIVAVLRGAKRHKDLIKTFAKIKTDAKLLIIGGGDGYESIKELILSLNLEQKVLMLGHREDISEILPNLDIFTLPSRHEALGTSLLEAQSCGVPVVASNVGGIPEALMDKKTGFLFDTFEELEEKLTLLLDDEKLRKSLAQNAREYIEQNFSISQMIQKTQALYKEILK